MTCDGHLEAAFACGRSPEVGRELSQPQRRSPEWESTSPLHREVPIDDAWSFQFQLHAHLNFRNRDGGNCDVVLICNDIIKIELRPLGIDQESRIKKQASQNRSSLTKSSRTCFSDSLH